MIAKVIAVCKAMTFAYIRVSFIEQFTVYYPDYPSRI